MSCYQFTDRHLRIEIHCAPVYFLQCLLSLCRRKQVRQITKNLLKFLYRYFVFITSAIWFTAAKARSMVRSLSGLTRQHVAAESMERAISFSRSMPFDPRICQTPSRRWTKEGISSWNRSCHKATLGVVGVSRFPKKRLGRGGR